MKGSLIAIALAGLLTVEACGSTRHVAVVANATTATAVFLVDDTERAACKVHTPPFTEQVCAELDPVLISMLRNGRRATMALQATPSDGRIPKSLPELQKDLKTLQTLMSAAVPGIAKMDLVLKIDAAIDWAIDQVNRFVNPQE